MKFSLLGIWSLMRNMAFLVRRSKPICALQYRNRYVDWECLSASGGQAQTACPAARA
jgi:hypothetical protein